MIMAGEDTCPAAMTERSVSRKVRNDMKTISDQPNGMPPEYAQAAEIASKTLIEDGLVQRKQFNSWEEAEKLHLPEFAKALAFAREHVTPDPDTEAFYRAAPKVEVMQKLCEIFEALPGLEKRKSLRIHFAPSTDTFGACSFERQCQKMYPDLDFSDAAGVFFPSPDDATSHDIILRSNITAEAVCHEIGHVIHESNDPAAYETSAGDSKWIDNAISNTCIHLKRNTTRELSRKIAQIDDSEYSGLRTILTNIFALVFKSKDDDGHKELMANIVGVYLSNHSDAVHLLEDILGFTSSEDAGSLISIARGYMANSGFSFEQRRF